MPPGLLPAVPSSVCLFHFFPSSSLCALILVSYHPSLAYENPAPSLIKGRHLWTTFPLFILHAFALARPSNDEPSLMSRHLSFWPCTFCRVSRCPCSPLMTTSRLAIDICLTSRHRQLPMSRHPPYTSLHSNNVSISPECGAIPPTSFSLICPHVPWYLLMLCPHFLFSLSFHLRDHGIVVLEVSPSLWVRRSSWGRGAAILNGRERAREKLSEMRSGW